VLPDEEIPAEGVKRIVICSGKIYYELLEARDAVSNRNVALVRLEQLYPFPEAELAAALKKYPDDTPLVWVQEEPENMGAWYFLLTRFRGTTFRRYPFSGVTRPASASPATGSGSSHRLEQKELIEKALTVS
jgi:2-oxoglutarate dehydrogenase E1 component